MSERLGRFEGDLFTQGLYPDLPDKQAPWWTDGSNIRFSERSVQPYPGNLIKFAKPNAEPVLGVLTTVLAGTPTIFWGTKTKLYKWTSSGVAQLATGFTGGEDDHWVFQRWGTWVLATNGVDAPQIYKGSSFSAISLVGAPFATCKLFLAWSQFMFALGCDTGDARVVLSDRDDPEDYVSTATNFATYKDLRDTASGIKAAGLLRGQPVVYTQNELHLLNYVGPPNILGTQKLLDGVGVLGPKALCEAEGLHYGFGPRGIWVTDGSSSRHVDHPAINDMIFDEINQDALDRVVAWHDKQNHHVMFFYPVGTETRTSKAVGFNYAEKNWTSLGYGRSAVDDSGIFPTAISGDYSGNIAEQALPGVPPTSTTVGSIELNATATLNVGFGECGFGQLGFGGSNSVSG